MIAEIECEEPKRVKIREEESDSHEGITASLLRTRFSHYICWQNTFIPVVLSRSSLPFITL